MLSLCVHTGFGGERGVAESPDGFIVSVKGLREDAKLETDSKSVE